MSMQAGRFVGIDELIQMRELSYCQQVGRGEWFVIR